MLSKFLGKKKESQRDTKNKELKDKISRMKLSDMRVYVKNNIKDFEVSEEGLSEVLKRLITADEKTKKYYIDESDMDEKKKKAFDLVLAILQSPKMNLETIELAQKFLEIYANMIAEFDKKHKQIYTSRFETAMNNAIATMQSLVDLHKKMDVLKQH